MKRFLSIVLSIVMVLAVVPAIEITASAAKLSDLVYEIWDGEVTITHCNASAAEVVIPNEIEGYPVTSID